MPAPPATEPCWPALSGWSSLPRSPFLITAGVWEWAADRLAVRPDIPEPLRTKIETCLSNGGYDTLFIGSSRYLHGIDPAVFDAEERTLGMSIHSYDLGIAAMNFPELQFVTRHVLQDPRMHLKYLFIEPSLRLRLAPGLEQSQRAIVLHDLKGSQSLFEMILRGNQDRRRKAYWLYQHANVSAIRLMNVGAFTNKFIHPQEPPPDLTDLLGTAGTGYWGLDPTLNYGPRTTAADIEKLKSDQSDAERAGTARQINSYEISQLTDLADEAAARGVRLFLLAPPTAEPDIYGEFSAISRANQSGMLRVPVFCFADAVKYPDLYQPTGFLDPDHVSPTVAALWSRHAADAFAGWLKEHD